MEAATSCRAQTQCSGESSSRSVLLRDLTLGPYSARDLGVGIVLYLLTSRWPRIDQVVINRDFKHF